jgi:hypothetical protein
VIYIKSIGSSSHYQGNQREIQEIEAEKQTPKDHRAELAAIEIKLAKSELRYKELAASAKRSGQISSTYGKSASDDEKVQQKRKNSELKKILMKAKNA